MAEVVIVGGGIAGLSAAHVLAKRGVDFLLLEAGPRWGGVIRSENVDGFVLDAGPDAILAQKPEGIALCRELGLGDRLMPTNPDQRAVFVLHRGRLHPLPEGMALAVPTRVLPFLASRLFSWPGKLRMGLDLVIRSRRESSDESIASFLRRRFGQEAVDRLGEPLLAGIHAGDPERLSILATFPRFAELERKKGSLIRGMLGARSAPRSGPPPAAFYSLPGGLGELVDALVARLPPASLRGRSPVRSLARAGAGLAVGLESGEQQSARAVILAVPPRGSASLMAPLAPEVSRMLTAIRFASSAVVFLGYRRADVAHPLDGYGLVVPKTEGLRTAAMSFVSTKFPGRAPDDKVLLRGFLGGIRDPDVLALDDASLVATLRRDMGPVLGLSGEPLMTRVFRWAEATPQMEVGHMDRVAEIERGVAAVPGLFLTGAGLRTTGIPDGVADGARAGVDAAAFVGR